MEILFSLKMAAALRSGGIRVLSPAGHRASVAIP
jgi:hypothetical protein